MRALPLLSLLLSCSAPSSNQPLTHQAYVWQRVWTPAVHEAVSTHDFDGLVALAAEVSWSDERAHIVRVEVPTKVAGVAVRIAVPPEGVDVADAVNDLLIDLQMAHPGAEIQIDMDLPTRRLSDYAGWMRDMKTSTTSPVVFTALPTWLDSSSLSEVAGASDGFVLQVHWFDPAHPNAPLLQPEAARDVQRAASIGVPFRVALPAYGHRVFLRDDQVIDVVSEEHAAPPAGAHAHRVMADPSSVASLLADLRTQHSATLTGVLWFRLPTAQDDLAWSATTLSAVRTGAPLASTMRVDRQPTHTANHDLCLTATGTLPWKPSAVPAADAIIGGGRHGWTWSVSRRSFVPSAHVPPLQPGEHLCVGWIRTGTSP